jgi:hypothetical protein
MIIGRSIGGFASKRLLGESRDPRHADAITLSHVIELRRAVTQLTAENKRLEDKVWLLEQELKRIERENVERGV